MTSSTPNLGFQEENTNEDIGFQEENINEVIKSNDDVTNTDVTNTDRSTINEVQEETEIEFENVFNNRPPKNFKKHENEQIKTRNINRC